MYGGTYLAHVLKSLWVICILSSSERAKKAKAQIDACFGFFVGGFQVSWLIYGNTFHYSQEALDCRSMNDDLLSLWNLEMVIIAFGYLVFFVVFMVCCCLSCICCCACFQQGDSLLS